MNFSIYNSQLPPVGPNGSSNTPPRLTEQRREPSQLDAQVEAVAGPAFHRDDLPPPANLREALARLEPVEGEENIDFNLLRKSAPAENPVFKAIRENNTKALKVLLKTNLKECNEQDNQGNTILHLAIQKGELKLVRTILNRLAQSPENFSFDLNTRNQLGETALSIAALQGGQSHLMALELLLKSGADAHLIYGEERHPIMHLAVLNNSTDLIQLLNRHAPDLISSVDIDGQTPLHLAVSLNHFTSVELLVSLGANLHLTTHIEDTPLQVALMAGNYRLAEYLIDQDPALHEIAQHENYSNETALHLLCAKSFSPIQLTLVQKLVEKGANINYPSMTFGSYIHQAVEQQNFELCEKLIDLGADLTLLNSEGENILLLAIYKKDARLVHFLLQKLKENKTNLFETTNTDGESILHYIVNSRSMEIFDLFFGEEHRHLSPDALRYELEVVNHENETPLQAAALANVTPMISALLENGAILEVKNRNGLNPLMMALESYSFKAAEVLLEKGCSVECMSLVSETALEFALDAYYELAHSDMPEQVENEIALLARIVAGILKRQPLAFLMRAENDSQPHNLYNFEVIVEGEDEEGNLTFQNVNQGHNRIFALVEIMISDSLEPGLFSKFYEFVNFKVKNLNEFLRDQGHESKIDIIRKKAIEVYKAKRNQRGISLNPRTAGLPRLAHSSRSAHRPKPY